MILRVVLVTHYYSTHRGGVEVVAAELANRLAKTRGWTVTWVASDTDPLPENLSSAVSCLPARAWNFFEWSFGVPWPIWSPFSLARLWRVIGNADIVHLHDAIYFGNAFAWLFARLRGVPVIVTQHTGSIPFRSAFLRATHIFVTRTLGRLVLSTARQTVFISPAVRDEFQASCRFRVPPLYYPNGVDTAVFFPDGEVADDLRIVGARRNGRLVFLFVGRFLEKKGVMFLRELAKRFPDDLWVFAGWGAVDPASWGLPNVHVVRGESGAGLARYYRAADLLMLPSLSEGFPLVVQEAMACGTPVMVDECSAGGSPDARPLMFVEQVGSDDTVDRWARRLSNILVEPEMLRARRSEAAEFAKSNWSWDSTAAMYASIFERAVQHDDKK